MGLRVRNLRKSLRRRASRNRETAFDFPLIRFWLCGVRWSSIEAGVFLVDVMDGIPN